MPAEFAGYEAVRRLETTDDIGDGPDAGPGPLTLEVDAWIGAVRQKALGPGGEGATLIESRRQPGRRSSGSRGATPPLIRTMADLAGVVRTGPRPAAPQSGLFAGEGEILR